LATGLRRRVTASVARLVTTVDHRQFPASPRQLAEFAEPLVSGQYTGPVHRWVLDTACRD
jgi:hypothetical protein